MSRHTYWIHGAGVEIENTAANGLKVDKKGFGTTIRQAVGTSNWFHFPITVPEGATIWDAYLMCETNRSAVIDRITVHHITNADFGIPRYYDEVVSLQGYQGKHSMNIPDKTCRGPMVLCVHVLFEKFSNEKDGPKVIFYGAAFSFNT